MINEIGMAEQLRWQEKRKTNNKTNNVRLEMVMRTKEASA
jgi:hypothetical protein